MRTFFLLMLLMSTVRPAAAAGIVFSPERPLSASAFGPAAGNQSFPSVASDSRQFFVVWRDSRTGGAIFGSRVSLAGDPIDQGGILISEAPNTQNAVLSTGSANPSMVWTGSEYVVVWTDATGSIRMSRVATDGTVLERARKLGPSGATDVRIATTGRTLLVTWSTPVDVRFQILSRTGEAIGPVRVIPAESTSSPERLDDVTASSNRYLILTTGGIGSQVTATLIDESGGIIRRVQSSSWIGLGGAAAGSDGSSFLLAIGTTNRFPYDLRIVKVTAAGDVVSDRTIRYEPGPAIAARIVWTGSQYEVLFTTGGFLQRVRVDAAGAPSQPIRISLGSVAPAGMGGASNGAKTLVAFGMTEPRAADSDLYGRFLDEEKTFAIAVSAVDQTHPSLAWNGRIFMTAWLELNKDAQGSKVFFNRIAPSGALLDGRGIVVTDFASPEMGSPAIASDGDTFLLAWPQADGKIRVQRVGADGLLMESATIDGCGYPCRDDALSLAFNGNVYLLTSTAGTVPIARVGIPIGAPFVENILQDRSAPVWTGSHFMVTVNERMPWGLSPGRLSGQLIDENNAILHRFPVSSATPGTWSDWTPFSSASNGDTVMIVWPSQHSTPSEIRGRVVSGFGDVADAGSASDPGLLIGGGEWDHARPVVIWDGISYVVVWQSASIGAMTSYLALQRFSGTGEAIGDPVVAANGTAYIPRGPHPPIARWMADARPAAIAFDDRIAIAYVRSTNGVNQVFMRVSVPARTRLVRR